MKKFVLFAAVVAMMTSCSHKETVTHTTESSTSVENSDKDTMSDNTTSYTSERTDATEQVSEARWTIERCDDGFEPNGNSLSKVSEVTSEEIKIEEKGSGENTYYVISPTINVTEPTEPGRMVAVILELLDDTETPIPYIFELAGNEYSQTGHVLSNTPALVRALKNGGECTLTFRIDPNKIEHFSTDMFDNAKYYRISGSID